MGEIISIEEYRAKREELSKNKYRLSQDPFHKKVPSNPDIYGERTTLSPWTRDELEMLNVFARSDKNKK